MELGSMQNLYQVIVVGTRDSSTTLADDLIIPPATSADSDSKN